MHSSGCVFALEVSEDLLDHRRFFDAGDDLDVTAAVLAGLDVDVENALQTLRLRLIAARRSTGAGPSVASAVRALPRLAGVTCARCALLGANTP